MYIRIVEPCKSPFSFTFHHPSDCIGCISDVDIFIFIYSMYECMYVCMYRLNEAQTMSLMVKRMRHFTFSFVSIQPSIHPSIHIYLSDIWQWCIFYSKSFINHGFQYNSFCLVIVSSMDTTAKKRKAEGLIPNWKAKQKQK